MAGQPVRDVPYLVLTVSASARRNDWFQIPALRDAHADLVRDVESGDQARVREALSVFRRAAVLSPDLLSRDGARPGRPGHQGGHAGHGNPSDLRRGDNPPFARSRPAVRRAARRLI